MPTDLKQIDAPKRKVESIETALRLVRDQYPGATKEGSLGSWSFWKDGRLVGEAWIHLREGWWLRIAPAEAQ